MTNLSRLEMTLPVDGGVQASVPSTQHPAPSTYLGRGYAGDSDLASIVELILTCDRVDRLDQGISADEMRMHLTEPGIDPERDVRVWTGADDSIIGFGHLMTPSGGEACDGNLRLEVHPEHRASDLPDAIIAWAADRLRHLAAERNQSACLRLWVREEDTARRSVLDRHGFISARRFPTLERPLTEPIEAPVFPDGFSARPLVAEEAAAWVTLFNESFVDHYNFHPETTEIITHWLADPDYQPQLNLVAIAPNGELVGFCWGVIYVAENERTGGNAGWIEQLGTRRGYRRLGLGRALLLTGLAALRQAGVDAARLGVDADSPTGATRLYESVGFRPIHTYLAYMKNLEPAGHGSS